MGPILLGFFLFVVVGSGAAHVKHALIVDTLRMSELLWLVVMHADKADAWYVHLCSVAADHQDSNLRGLVVLRLAGADHGFLSHIANSFDRY